MSFKKYLSLFGLLAIMSPLVVGQDEGAEDEDDVEEVVVTGIKKSLLSAIDIKRSNTGIVDAITAEDFGKFPDNNLAESLARVVGIGIDRSNVEGERVAVRGFGPEFNLVTLNGRQMPTVPGQWEGGRSFNFGDISSHGVAAVEVYKSTNSSLPSGGIGSTINMVTTKPLLIEDTLNSFSIDLLDDSTSEEGDLKPEFNFVHSSNFGNWGLAVSGSYQDRNNREEGTRESNWIIVEDKAREEGYFRVDKNAAGITNNNTRPDGKTFYQEPTAYLIKDNDRVRKNAQVALQFEVNEDLIATVDYTYSKVEFRSTGQFFGPWLGGWNTQSGTIDTNGVYTDVVVGERGYDHQAIWGNVDSINKSKGFNLEWTASDNLTIVLDYHDSSAEKDGTELPNEIGFTTPQGTVSHTNAGTSGIHTFSFDRDFTADDFTFGGAYIRDAFKENLMDQTQLKGEYTFDDGVIKSIQFGFSRVDSEFNDTRMENPVTPTPGTAANASIFTKTGMGGFMDSFNTNFANGYYFAIDTGLAIGEFVKNFGALTAGPIDTNDKVEETLRAAYIQANLEFNVNDRPLNVVIGLRNEETDLTSTALEAVPSNIRWDMIDGLVYPSGGDVPIAIKNNSSILLPQLVLAYEFLDDQVLRFGYGKSMSRPGLDQLKSSYFFGNKDWTKPTAERGNPYLDALESENLDIAYEFYYDEGSYFSVNYFRKEIDNFVTSEKYEDNLYGLRNPAANAIGQYAIACVTAWDQAGRPDPGFPGEWGSGDCVSQQALWAQGDWMNIFHHMGWVALAMHRGVDVSNGFPWGQCDYDGWWRCEPGYIDATSSDPLAIFEITTPRNMGKGEVDGWEVVLQHLFGDTGWGVQLNATIIEGGDVDVDRYAIGRQFLLPGLGDSSNFSVFYEDERITARVALNTRGETVAGFGDYDQPLYVEERNQWDATFTYRWSENAATFLEVQNLNDEPTRLYARHPNMLFLSQDHGPIYRLGFRYKF